MKKTVREQLEELRTNDNVFEGSGDRDSTSLSRVRKRKSMSDSQGRFEANMTCQTLCRNVRHEYLVLISNYLYLISNIVENAAK